MTKTITREYWVNKDDFDGFARHDSFIPLMKKYIGLQYSHKITITFEVPEKKIELTESEFDGAWQSLTYSELDNAWYKRFEILKEKLFGRSEG